MKSTINAAMAKPMPTLFAKELTTSLLKRRGLKGSKDKGINLRKRRILKNLRRAKGAKVQKVQEVARARRGRVRGKC